jgi:hypothetical protein
MNAWLSCRRVRGRNRDCEREFVQVCLSASQHVMMNKFPGLPLIDGVRVRNSLNAGVSGVVEERMFGIKVGQDVSARSLGPTPSGRCFPSNVYLGRYAISRPAVAPSEGRNSYQYCPSRTVQRSAMASSRSHPATSAVGLLKGYE